MEPLELLETPQRNTMDTLTLPAAEERDGVKPGGNAAMKTFVAKVWWQLDEYNSWRQSVSRIQALEMLQEADAAARHGEFERSHKMYQAALTMLLQRARAQQNAEAKHWLLQHASHYMSKAERVAVKARKRSDWRAQPKPDKVDCVVEELYQTRNTHFIDLFEARNLLTHLAQEHGMPIPTESDIDDACDRLYLEKHPQTQLDQQELADLCRALVDIVIEDD